MGGRTRQSASLHARIGRFTVEWRAPDVRGRMERTPKGEADLWRGLISMQNPLLSKIAQCERPTSNILGLPLKTPCGACEQVPAESPH